MPVIRMYAEFEDEGSLKFQTKWDKDTPPNEFQFAVIGREFTKLADMLAVQRLSGMVAEEKRQDGDP